MKRVIVLALLLLVLPGLAEATYTLSDTLTDAADSAIEGAYVKAYNKFTQLLLDTDTTDAAGVYSVDIPATVDLVEMRVTNWLSGAPYVTRKWDVELTQSVMVIDNPIFTGTAAARGLTADTLNVPVVADTLSIRGGLILVAGSYNADVGEGAMFLSADYDTLYIQTATIGTWVAIPTE